MNSKTVITSFVLSLLMVVVISAQIPQTISFQGKLVEGGTPVNGTRNIHFYLYDTETGGTPLWDEDHDTVNVVDGLFNVKLGEITSFASAGVDFSEQYWIGIRVDGGSELSPRYKLSAAPYALNAVSSATDNDWEISGDNMFSVPSGNIGIGTTTPTGKLNINTNIDGVRYGLRVDEGPDNSTENYGIYVRDNSVGASNDYIRHDIYAENHHYQTGTGYTPTTSYCAIAGYDLDAGNYNFGIGGWSYLDYDYSGAVLGASHSGGTWGSIAYKNGSGKIWAGYFNGDGYFSDSVGIGTENPKSELHVNGVITVPWSFTLQHYSYFGASDPDNIHTIMHKGWSGTFGDYLYIGSTGNRPNTDQGSILLSEHAIKLGKGTDEANDLSVSNMYLNLDNGRVGIGTSSPSAQLDIEASEGEAGLIVNSYTTSSHSSWNKISSSGTGVVLAVSADSSIHNDGILLLSEHSDSSSTYFLRCDSYTGGWHPVFIVKGDGKVGIGTSHPTEQLEVNGALKITGGSDLSEQFEIKKTVDIDKILPGMIVSLDDKGKGELVVSSKAYDSKVVGVVSGAGGIKTGMILTQAGSEADGKYPVAIAGRVYCYADASEHPIHIGDLLTTSDIPGYAMKVTDYEKAKGAIIGKAMSSLESGRGLVLILVTLQ